MLFFIEKHPLDFFVDIFQMTAGKMEINTLIIHVKISVN